jgi:catechol 2,3-dioxygenase-like lactoylglutathione lyase family enzyme
MLIERVTLLSENLEHQDLFYRDVLGLTVERAEFKVLVHAGETLLEFQQATHNWQGAYHFAFDIPENHVRKAYDRLQYQVEFFPGEHGDIIHHASWDAHSLYFRDPAGNVVELIGRHTQGNASDGTFGPESILHMSEIGLPSEDVQRTVRKLQADLELDVYDSEIPAFSAVGDPQGLIIVTSLDRIWYPNTRVPSSYNPVEICLVLNSGERYQINAPPYPCEITPWFQ